MTDVIVSQPKRRWWNALTAKAFRRWCCFGLAISVVGLLSFDIVDDAGQPRFQGGPFNSDFSDAVDIDRWEYRFPLGTSVFVTNHDAYVQNRTLGISFTFDRW